MIERIRRHKISFKHAWDGVLYTIKSQPNFQFHLCAMVLVIIGGIFFQIKAVEWLILIFTFNFVLVAEMLNTSVESVVDLITQEKRQDAKVAKDVASGMVLVSAFFSVLVGIIVFLPKILELF